ncbi:MAG TPA: glycosyltransferase, partial [Longimicrobium sp.]|nr:glycosyltransferase [Longimicrobium sp.]
MTPTDAPARPLTVGICTRDRHASLLRCLRSLRHAEDLIDRVVVVDDASPAPVEPAIRAAASGDLPGGIEVIRADAPIGLSAG